MVGTIQPLSYGAAITVKAAIAVIDLEANAPEGEFSVEDMEIIEIGVVLISSTGGTLMEYQSFVRPERLREFSSFCKKHFSPHLDEIKAAPPLKTALMQLELAVKSCELPLTAWASWGNYDRNHIALECQRLSVAHPLPAPHINAKAAFAKRTGTRVFAGKQTRRQLGLTRALSECGLPFVGQPHRALCDARNVARLFRWWN